MRDFFLNLLNNLDKLAGLKQLDKIYASHGENLSAAKTEIKKLLDVLCNVSLQFPFIPEKEQQKIITHCVVSEEFNSLNGNTLYKWLAKNKDKYFKESHHLETPEPEAEPLTGEARNAKIQEWLKSLAPAQAMIVGKATEAELKFEKQKMRGDMEWLREERPKDLQDYRSPSEQEVYAKELHIQYVRENYDPYTAKPKATWISEEEWLKINT